MKIKLKNKFRKKPLIIILITFIIIQATLLLHIFGANNFNYTDAFAKSILYYEASWCGPDAGENRLPWRGPCHIEDGADVGIDLTGGFHDAGDHVKFGQPQAYTASTLGWAYYEFKDAFIEKGQDEYMLNILKHFTDYFLKSYVDDTTFYYQCGDGSVDHAYWGPPELQSYDRPTLFVATPETPASEMCASAAAALAQMYLNYNDIDAEYAEKCLTAAEKLYDFANTYRGLGESGGFYGSTNYLDELCWGAVWLNIATGDSSYIDDVDSFMLEKNITQENDYSNHWTHCWEDVYGGVFIKLAHITDNPLYKKVAEENLNYYLTDAPRTPGGVVYINSWGALRYTAAECMMALVHYKYTDNEDYLDFSKEQIDYILGDNPRNSSYVVGFGENYPQNPHHRASSGRYEWQPAIEHKSDPQRHLLYGALVGGPDSNDEYTDDVEEYAYSEVAIDYNAGFVGAMAGMTEYFGEGQTAEETPGIEDLSIPVNYADAKVMEEDSEHVTIDVFMHNETILPPHFYNNLSFRYFVDLSEYYEIGMTADDVTPMLNYGAFDGKLSELKPWNEAANIYYVEGSWPNIDIYGNVELQFALSNYNTDVWDSSNDFSYQGLTAEKAISERVPVYQNGELLFGSEPSQTEVPTPTPTSPTSTTSSPPITGDIHVNYNVRSEWEDGATIQLTITNNTTASISGWKLVWDYIEGQTIDEFWSSIFTQEGTTVTAQGLNWNLSIPVDESVSFGFNLKHTGQNPLPTSFELNGIQCVIDQ
ncbi:MAG: glycoside hydrolase family 9 protein [Clostridiales bacterium]